MNGQTRSLSRAALLVLVCAALTMPLRVVSAGQNETFGVTPYPEQSNNVERGTFAIPLEPGATFEDAIRIYNRTDQQLDLAVYAADAEAGPEDTDITAGFRNDSPEGVGSWIDLARESVELAPRDEIIVTFRIEVKNSDPKPRLGAIVVENTARGLSSNAAQREFLPVITNAPNTETTSVRVRPLLLRSPWIVVAMLGLVVAAALIWIGARRARRPKDVLVPAGEIEQPELDEDVPEASRPVIKRLGAPEPENEPAAVTATSRRRAPSDDRPLLEDAFLVEVELPEDEVRTSDDAAEDEEDDDFDEAFEEDDEDDLPPARPRPAVKRSPAKVRAKPQPPPKVIQKKKPVAKKAAPKKKPARPAAAKKKAAPARKATNASREPKEPKGYIPLDEL